MKLALGRVRDWAVQEKHYSHLFTIIHEHFDNKFVKKYHRYFQLEIFFNKYHGQNNIKHFTIEYVVMSFPYLHVIFPLQMPSIYTRDFVAIYCVYCLFALI